MDFTTGFSCPECQTQPEVMIMDATSLAFRKDFLVWKSSVANTLQQHPKEPKSIAEQR